MEKRHTCPSLQCIILIEPPTDSLLQKANNSGVEITTFDEVQKLGIASKDRLPPQQPMVRYIESQYSTYLCRNIVNLLYTLLVVFCLGHNHTCGATIKSVAKICLILIVYNLCKRN